MTEDVKAKWRLALLLIAILFALFLWPGMWGLAILGGPNGQALVRVNKITGAARVVIHTMPPAPSQQPAGGPRVLPPGVP